MADREQGKADDGARSHARLDPSLEGPRARVDPSLARAAASFDGAQVPVGALPPVDGSGLLEKVIHRINNPLASMLVGLSRLVEQLAKLGDRGALGEALRVAVDARAEGERVAGAVRELRGLFPADAPRRIDAQGVLGTVLTLLEQQEPGTVVIERRFPELLPVFVREARFAQVFRSAGQLAIDLLRGAQSGGAVGLLVEAEERSGQLHVSLRGASEQDSLSGFVGERGERLTMLRGMVQQLGGSLEASGSGLRLTLPVDAPVYDSEAEVDLTRRASVPPRGEMRILVVDDEISMHRALCRGLAELGAVQAVRSMGSAVELLQGGATFDAILADLIMAEGTGLELIEWLGANYPQMRRRTILMTGMGETHADSHPDIVVIGKPFDLPSLRELVCQVATRA